MHLLATSVASLEDTAQAVDLAHSPADVVVLSFQDSDLAALAAAWTANRESLPSLRLASLKDLTHPMSIDLYADRTIAGAKAVVVRALGGLDYWRYGFERIAGICRHNGIPFAAVPGCDRPDPRLIEISTVAPDVHARLSAYLRFGGSENATAALRFLGDVIAGAVTEAPEPRLIGPAAALTVDGRAVAPQEITAVDGRPAALVVFYRASLLAADVTPIAALMAALEDQGLAPVAVAVTSLKDPEARPVVEAMVQRLSPAVILNATAFSAQGADGSTALDFADATVLQVVQSQTARGVWAASPRALTPADLAMNVVLPELDGRLLARTISFKTAAEAHAELEFAPVLHAPDPGRIAFVARLAAAWARLRGTPPRDRRITLMLSDYPSRLGRAGYAVGLDTAASVAEALRALDGAGYTCGEAHPGKDRVEALLRGEADMLRVPLDGYEAALAELPSELRSEITSAWDAPASDPLAAGGAFHFPVLRAGNLTILLQPGRGSRTDAKAGYHDATTPPRHAYVALYWHLRREGLMDALVHVGAHGTLEWLPGKALALSEACWPEVILGPTPVLYPFIANNPGEAMQAKRRLGAVAIGHLTPPLSMAGLHGELAGLEALVDEYAEADGLDRRRLSLLEGEIVARAWRTGLARDCGLGETAGGRDAVAVLDARLCDIKELAVRQHLHVFGRTPEAPALASLAESLAATACEGAAASGNGHDFADRIRASAANEIAALLAGLDGRRVAPGPAGAPSRGRSDVLPTGRNLTAIDPRAIPTRTAAVIGARAADEVIRRFLQDHGTYPTSLVLDLWASASLRTGGDDLAQALSYLGCRPQWDPASQRVTGIEILPLARLDRPRIDVTLRISGLFRDLFEAQIALFDLAIERLAHLNEAAEDNPLAAARMRGESLARIFGGAPGTFGAATAGLALDGAWKSRADLGRAYLDATSHAYGRYERADASRDFADRVGRADALVHPQDDRERDILDGDDVADFAGGFAAAAELLGKRPDLVHLDTSKPDSPRARSFAHEVSRIVRGRLTNPSWLSAMLDHGHRGGAEIAEAVDALFAFAATSEAAPSHLFDAAHEAILADEAILARLAAANPAALAAIALRLADARARGLWTPRRNAAADEVKRAITLAEARTPRRKEAAE